MKMSILAAGLVFLCLTIGFVPLASADVSGNSVPVISQAFASPHVCPGENWKVYLNASDPHGEMRNIYVVVEQQGLGPHPLAIIRIKKGNQKELSGYIYLTTFTPYYSLNFTNLTLTAWIQGRDGNFSAPVTLPLSINARYTREPAPAGVYKNHDLGPVMVNLRTPGM
jgi:hypothetical protein